MTNELTIFSIIWAVVFSVAAMVYRKSPRIGKPGLVVLVPAFCFTAFATWQLSFKTETLAVDERPAEKDIITSAVYEPFRPIEIAADGYTKASACLECHGEQYESWHDSYHRTMTQVATTDSVMGNFKNQTVTFNGRTYKMTEDGELCWVELPANVVQPEGQNVPPNERTQLPIVMSTGSHHMQVYWFPMGKGRMLGQFPLVYLKEEDRWVPRKSCFLEPPTDKPDIEVGRWNNTCLQCHTTNPKQLLSRDFVFDTQVSEFGISCEACHGPGEEHIAFHRTRLGNSGDGVGPEVTNVESTQPLDPIINPRDLDHRLSSQVCGNCHSMATHLDPATRNNGHTFRPGKELSESRHLYRCNPDSEALLERQGQDPDAFYDSVFWNDGMIRVTGREFSGVAESPCYLQGTMSCISCHSMHKEAGDAQATEDWANDQLAIDMDGDHACTQCHNADDYGKTHTHHESTSSGSRCYNCHMPHTSYGLMKANRSHQLFSPNVAKDETAGRPNACNLCHLDKTLQWTANKLESWYGIETPELSKYDSTLATGVNWALRGDAGIRAIVAWHMGWQPAIDASHSDWMARYLVHLLTDPYDIVRYIAGKSLTAIEGFGDLDYDYVAEIADRLTTQADAIKRWDQAQDTNSSTGDHVLVSPEGKLLMQQFRALAAQRDDKPMFLNE
ncbi:multiheme c-type cytochrome [bacterium]|nr:multiheme c-type cytochrome [bacterium]